MSQRLFTLLLTNVQAGKNKAIPYPIATNCNLLGSGVICSIRPTNFCLRSSRVVAGHVGDAWRLFTVPAAPDEVCHAKRFES